VAAAAAVAAAVLSLLSPGNESRRTGIAVKGPEGIRI